MSNSVMLPLDAFGGAAGLEESDEVKRLRSTNELWKEYAPRWAFYLSAYEGGEAFAIASNLFKHQRENQTDYEDRLKRLDNMNYCEPVVDFFTNFIFSESIDRSGVSNEDFYRDFVKDVSLRKETIDDFMRQVEDDAQIFGLVYVLVDAPKLPAEVGVISKQYEQDNNLRPYWVIITPEQITDWVCDGFGTLVYAKRREECTEFRNGSPCRLERYTEFYTTYTAVSEIDITDPKKPVVLPKEPVVINTLGEIPIRVARHKPNKTNPHLGSSFLKDFAYNNRKILNLTSMLDEFLYRQCFNILGVEVESGIPLAEQSEGDIGTSNVMSYPKGAKTPSYITPPVDPAKVLQDERARIINQIFLRASQEMGSEMSNGEKSSGFSQSQSFSRTVPFISSRADMLERVETSLMELTMKILGKTWDGKIKYKDRYELTSLTSALTQLQILVKDFQIPSETFVKSQLKRMVHEYDGKLPLDDQIKVDKEIDSMNFPSWMADQKIALLGAPPTSPGAQQKPKQGDATVYQKDSGHSVNVSATTKLQE